MFKLQAWTFCNERHEVLLYLQSSTGINSERNSRKKRARKKRKAVPLEAKQEVKQAHSNQRTWPCSSSSLILCHFWTRKRFPLIVDSASLTGQVFQYIVSGSIRAKSPVHGFHDYVRLKQSNLKKKERKEQKIYIEEKEINQNLHLDYSCCVLSECTENACGSEC